MARTTDPLSDPKVRRAVTQIASLLTIEAPVPALTAKIATVLEPFDLRRESVVTAVQVGMTRPVTQIRKVNRARALQVVRSFEYQYRAAFIVASALRMEAAMAAGKTRSAASNDERLRYRRHLDAQNKRLVTAREIDLLVTKRKGDSKKVGWYAKLDARTSPDCRAAHGRNFEVDQRPPMGYPGAVHPNCRCRAGRPHATSLTVYDLRTPRSERRVS